jgi:hypothetical protein
MVFAGTLLVLQSRGVNFSRFFRLHHQQENNVLGAPIPRLHPRPYMPTEVLRLYRDFWKIIYRHPAAEQPELAFKLRNNFRSKLHYVGKDRIQRALRAGGTALQEYKEKLELRRVKETVKHCGKGELLAGDPGQVWERLQIACGHRVPGIGDADESRTLRSLSAERAFSQPLGPNRSNAHVGSHRVNSASANPH